MENYLKSPLWNNRLPVEERLDYLIGEMTTEEKIACLTTGCPDISRLGILLYGRRGSPWNRSQT